MRYHLWCLYSSWSYIPARKWYPNKKMFRGTTRPQKLCSHVCVPVSRYLLTDWALFHCSFSKNLSLTHLSMDFLKFSRFWTNTTNIIQSFQTGRGVHCVIHEQVHCLNIKQYTRWFRVHESNWVTLPSSPICLLFSRINGMPKRVYIALCFGLFHDCAVAHGRYFLDAFWSSTLDLVFPGMVNRWWFRPPCSRCTVLWKKTTQSIYIFVRVDMKMLWCILSADLCVQHSTPGRRVPTLAAS